MCEFCIDLKSPIQVARLPIAESDLNVGDFGKSNVSLYIRKNEKRTYLELTIDNYGLGGRTVRKTSPVLYCPRCGTRLSDDEEE